MVAGDDIGGAGIAAFIAGIEQRGGAERVGIISDAAHAAPVVVLPGRVGEQSWRAGVGEAFAEIAGGRPRRQR